MLQKYIFFLYFPNKFKKILLFSGFVPHFRVFPGFLKDYEAVVSWFEVASLRRLAFLVFHKAIEVEAMTTPRNRNLGCDNAG